MSTAQDFLAALSESIGIPLAFREDLTCCLSTPEGRRGSPFLDASMLNQNAIHRTETNAAGKKNQQEFWGENYHAIIAAMDYNRPVVVISTLQVQVLNPDGSVQNLEADSLQTLKNQNPIVLLYNGTNHWDAAAFL